MMTAMPHFLLDARCSVVTFELAEDRGGPFPASISACFAHARSDISVSPTSFENNPMPFPLRFHAATISAFVLSRKATPLPRFHGLILPHIEGVHEIGASSVAVRRWRHAGKGKICA